MDYITDEMYNKLFKKREKDTDKAIEEERKTN